MKPSHRQRVFAIASLLVFGLLIVASIAFLWRLQTVLVNSAPANQSWDEQDIFYESTRHALRIGPKEQRMEILNHLADQGLAASQFIDDIREAAADRDPEIAMAAKDALDRILSGVSE